MFFKSRKYLKNTNDTLFKRNTELSKINIYLQMALKDKDKTIEELNETNKTLENSLVTTTEILDDKRKEIKRLKTLLTRNGIEYRKEN